MRSGTRQEDVRSLQRFRWPLALGPRPSCHEVREWRFLCPRCIARSRSLKNLMCSGNTTDPMEWGDTSSRSGSLGTITISSVSRAGQSRTSRYPATLRANSRRSLIPLEATQASESSTTSSRSKASARRATNDKRLTTNESFIVSERSERSYVEKRGSCRAIGIAVRCLSITPDDSTHRRVVCGDIHLNRVTGNNPDHSTLAHLPRCASRDLVTSLQFHPECGVGKRLNNDTLRSEIVVLACDKNLQSIGSALHYLAGRFERVHRTVSRTLSAVMMTSEREALTVR